jgi:shikimate dehydrogenase
MPKPLNFLSLLTGSFAAPAAENPTVAMIEAAYRHHDLDARYINCEVAPDDLGDAVRGARAMGWAGFNCSIPHKVAVIEHLDGLGASAALIGAVNCVVRRNGRWIGENTDGQGFLTALRTVVDPAGKSLVLFGAGGAARAIAVESALAGAASITVVNRDPDRGTGLVSLLNENTQTRADLVVWDTSYRVPPEGRDIVVNATSIGLFPDIEGRLDLDPDGLRPGMVVADVIPNPPRTPLLRDAEARGATVLDGLGMLVNQGVISIRHWTGIEADPTVMRRKVEDLFEL